MIDPLNRDLLAAEPLAKSVDLRERRVRGRQRLAHRVLAAVPQGRFEAVVEGNIGIALAGLSANSRKLLNTANVA
jgi:hypothetical protein